VKERRGEMSVELGKYQAEDEDDEEEEGDQS